MVEMVFLFPLIVLMLACMLQMLLVAHLHLKLQRSAVRLAQRVAIGQSSELAQLDLMTEYRNSHQWMIPIARLSRLNLPMWRQYKGESTATAQNCMVVADIGCPLYTNWFATVGLTPVILRAHAELLCEPADIEDPA